MYVSDRGRAASPSAVKHGCLASSAEKSSQLGPLDVGHANLEGEWQGVEQGRGPGGGNGIELCRDATVTPHHRGDPL
nr:hypothetical protein CFP56_19496 [Quercus suber]